MTTGDYFDKRPPPLYETLARIEGQSNFLSLLVGIEAGPDTTEPMGALGFAKLAGATPEVLEAHVARSRLFQRPIMSMVFCTIVHELNAERKAWPWIQGAVADAFIELRDGSRFVKPVKDRARHFCVDASVYGVMRKVAGRILDDLLSFARAKFYRAMRSIPSSPGIRQNTNRKGGEFHEFYWTRCEMQGMGHFRALPLSSSWDSEDDDDGDGDAQFTPNLALFRETNGWAASNAKPAPVLTLYGVGAEEHRRKYPAHSNRPHSL